MNKIIYWLSIAMILLSLTLMVNAITDMITNKKIKELEQQINEIKFIKEYEDYVKEDYERQME